MNTLDNQQLQQMAHAVRALSVDMVEAAGSGHPGMPLGAADIITVLFGTVLKHKPSDPLWPDRDRFVLSAGHASAMLYATLHLAGYPLSEQELRNFRQLGAVTSGHPEVEQHLGIECTTGPLGQGIGMGVGMAIAERAARARNPEGIDHYTWVLAGEGCLMEGISHEACSLAGRLRLSRLILLFDDNNNTIDGRGSLSCSDDVPARFRAYGWETLEADGHSYAAIEAVLNEAKTKDRPVMVRFKTTIGRFSPLADSHAAHGSVLGAERAAETRRALGLETTPFTIAPGVTELWKSACSRNAAAYAEWQKNAHKTVAKIDEAQLEHLVDAYKRDAAGKDATATRAASGEVLSALTAGLPNLIGGSADLTGPTQTLTDSSVAFDDSEEPAEAPNYIYYGVREHGMGAVMNGIALHGPFVPYGGTFLAFGDYMKPAIRLAAIMGQQVIFVMTHDTIAIGEDGPTHQPVEHFSAYRSVPNLLVIRPADRTEVAEGWQVALQNGGRPSMIVLTRLPVEPVFSEYRKENLVAEGGYLVVKADGVPAVTLVASGSELAPMKEAAKSLAADGITCDVVSMPCLELFLEKSDAERGSVIRGKKVIVVEAASTPGWDRLVPGDVSFHAMRTFGASGKKDALVKHFGYDARSIDAAVRSRLA